MGSRARTVLTTAAAFVLLVAAWELAKLVLPAAGVTFGGVRLLPRPVRDTDGWPSGPERV
jgi:NitT/TauT family transport system permease protein